MLPIALWDPVQNPARTLTFITSVKNLVPVVVPSLDLDTKRVPSYLLGTRIIYERKFLLELRNSPLSRTPPQNLPPIPGVTCDNKVKPASPKDNGVPNTESENDKNDDNHGQ